MEPNKIKKVGKINKASVVLFAIASFLLLLQAICFGLKSHLLYFDMIMFTLCTIGATASTIMLCFKKFGGFCGVLSFTIAYLIVFLFQSRVNSIDIFCNTIGYIIPWTCIIIGLCIRTENTSTFKYLLTDLHKRKQNITNNYITYFAIPIVLYFVFLFAFSVAPKCGFAPIGNIRVDAATWLIKVQLAWNGFEKESETYYTRKKTTIHNNAMNEIEAIGLADKGSYTSVVFFMRDENNEAYEKIKNDLVNTYGHYYADADLDKSEIIEVWQVKQGTNVAQIELHSARMTWGWAPASLLDCSVIDIYIRVSL